MYPAPNLHGLSNHRGCGAACRWEFTCSATLLIIAMLGFRFMLNPSGRRQSRFTSTLVNNYVEPPDMDYYKRFLVRVSLLSGSRFYCLEGREMAVLKSTHLSTRRRAEEEWLPIFKGWFFFFNMFTFYFLHLILLTRGPPSRPLPCSEPHGLCY